MKKSVVGFGAIISLGALGWTVYYVLSVRTPRVHTVTTPPTIVMSFDDCLKAGYPVMESYSRQCKTPGGRTYTEELPPTKPTYTNATSGVISAEIPAPDSVTGKEFEVRGTASGWYFEGSFPIEILDANGKVLVAVPAQAQSDWITSAPVRFIAKIKVPTTYIGKAIILLKKDNPSGLPENDASMSFPITIEY